MPLSQRLVRIASNISLQDASEPAGRYISHLDGEPKDKVGDLPDGARDGDLGTGPLGNVDFAPVALVQRRGLFDLSREPRQVDEFISPIAHCKLAQLLGYEVEPLRLFDPGATKLAVYAHVDQLKAKDRRLRPRRCGNGRRKQERERHEGGAKFRHATLLDRRLRFHRVTSGELDSGTCRRKLHSQIDIVVSIADPDRDCKTAGDGLATTRLPAPILRARHARHRQTRDGLPRLRALSLSKKKPRKTEERLCANVRVAF